MSSLWVVRYCDTLCRRDVHGPWVVLRSAMLLSGGEAKCATKTFKYRYCPTPALRDVRWDEKSAGGNPNKVTAAICLCRFYVLSGSTVASPLSADTNAMLCPVLTRDSAAY
eukprot:2427706-Rhodomonas_salina.3